MTLNLSKEFAAAALVCTIAAAVFSGSASGTVIFTNSHTYTASSGGVIHIDVAVEDNFMGDFGKY